MRTITYIYNCDDVLSKQDEFLKKLKEDEKNCYLLSLKNYMDRKNKSHEIIDLKIGDIGYFDFGDAYRFEIGYQHLGVVISIVKQKIFVVPIISKKANSLLYTQMFLPKTCSSVFRTDSIALLNDSKWISQSRTINRLGSIESKDILHNIKSNVIKMIL